MNAGSLNRRVTIEKRKGAVRASRDEAGQQVDAWEQVAVRWANITGQTGMGTITGQQDNVSASIEKYSIRIRYFEGAAAGMRALHGHQVFAIQQVRHDMARREYTDLVCEVGGVKA